MQQYQGHKDTLKKTYCEPVFIQDNFILRLNRNKLVHSDNIFEDVANLKIKYRDFMIVSQPEKIATICRLSYSSRTFLSRKSMLVYSRKEKLTIISFQSIVRGGFLFFLVLVTVASLLQTGNKYQLSCAGIINLKKRNLQPTYIFIISMSMLSIINLKFQSLLNISLISFKNRK